MQVKVTFKPEDFKTMRTFESAVRRQLGKNVYVGTDSMCIYLDYPKELKAMLRPFPPAQQLEFTLDSTDCPQ